VLTPSERRVQRNAASSRSRNVSYAMAKCPEEGVVPGKDVLAPRKTSNCLDTYADQKLYPSGLAKFRQRLLAFFRFDANVAESLLLGNS
jgi:hypothetical protein